MEVTAAGDVAISTLTGEDSGVISEVVSGAAGMLRQYLLSDACFPYLGTCKASSQGLEGAG